MITATQDFKSKGPKSEGEHQFTDGTNYCRISNIVQPETANKIRTEMKFRPNDILLATYPRSGTTLTSNLLFEMVAGSEGSKIREQKNFRLFDVVVFLEYENVWHQKQGLEERKNGFEKIMKQYHEDPTSLKTRVIKTHLPKWFLPDICSDQKTVLVTRNPKDCCTSFYHMYRNDKSHGPGITDTIEFSTFFDMWMDKEVGYGDWVDWHNQWLAAYRKSGKMENLHIVYYEDILQDFEKTMEKLAAFVGIAQENVDLEKLKEVGNFQNMKAKLKIDVVKDFVRKGQVGDYLNSFTEEQVKVLDRDVEARLDKFFKYRCE